MKHLDRVLQNWRLKKAVGCIGPDARVIDVGAHQGELFRALGPKLCAGFGVEPLLRTPVETPTYRIQGGLFPDMRPDDTGWDAITMLAVLEHIPRPKQANLAAACFDLLKPGGRVIITVPSKAVDQILSVLRSLRLIEGMSLEEHFGFEPDETVALFSSPRFRLIRHERFQFGLNHLFVFAKEPSLEGAR